MASTSWLRSLLTPRDPPYTAQQWTAQPFAERLRMSCQAWALDGYGSPPAIYGLYLVKLLIYVAAWVGFAALGDGADWSERLLSASAFKKAVLWSMLFESLGLGCGSGPLTGRYRPPVSAPLHFLRPGTLRLAPWPSLRLLGGSRRNWLHVGLYLGFIAALLWALLTPVVMTAHVAPVLILLVVLGLTDKTIFLAARSEHYGVMLLCFMFGDDWVAGAIAVQLSIWIWAAISKINRHFPAVVCVMVSNSPWLRSHRLKKAMYRAYPEDLRPSGLAHGLAHFGTALELCFPLLLWAGEGGVLTVAGLVLMVLFHAFITANFPMAVPIEWNVMVVAGGCYLFGLHPEVGPQDIASPMLVALLTACLVLVPLIGNLRPRWVSFLMSMRYYAGNWAFSVWLFRGEAADKLSAIPKASDHPEQQLRHFYSEETVVTLMSKVPAFRAMHLHGRALQQLLPKAVDSMEAYTYVDGEIIAGMVLGYNFGDGHLHDHRLLGRVQEVCGFGPGELRHIAVESQPLLGSGLRWEIRDASEGLLDSGEIMVADLMALQPWPRGS